MRIRIENAGNITSAAIESAGITVLGGPNIEGRNTLLKAAYAAARAKRLELLEDSVGHFSRETGPDDARAHAELNRCAPNIEIGKGGSVHMAVDSGDDASTGTPVHLGVDRIALTRQKWTYDPRADGTPTTSIDCCGNVRKRTPRRGGNGPPTGSPKSPACASSRNAQRGPPD